MSDYEYLVAHAGHNIVITHYEREGEVCVECEDCNEVILSIWEEDPE